MLLIHVHNPIHLNIMKILFKNINVLHPAHLMLHMLKMVNVQMNVQIIMLIQ